MKIMSKQEKLQLKLEKWLRIKDWIGKTVYEICEEVENEIRKERCKMCISG